MKRIAAFLFLAVFLVPEAFSQEYAPGEVFVIFKPDTSITLFRNQSGQIACGLTYIDSVNIANGCDLGRTNGDFGVAAVKRCFFSIMRFC